MSKTHNKKRNTALLYEFLIHTISSALVEDDKKKSSIALKILKKHFKHGTQLYKEFRLFNALIKTTVSSNIVASSIISEAKSAALISDMRMLDREKSFLIKSINHFIKEENFYDQPIVNYRLYATVQTLLNEWRKPAGTSDIAALASYEEQLYNWLLSEKKKDDYMVSEETPGTTRLLTKVMIKKLNEKYSLTLNTTQRDIIKAYAFSTSNDNQTIIKKKLEEIKTDLLSCIEQYITHKHENVYLIDKMQLAKSKILSESLDVVDDSVISNFMLYSTLHQELTQSEEIDL